jgi:alpha-glucosidase (family GH31 glycosyl hydrolase)
MIFQICFLFLVLFGAVLCELVPQAQNELSMYNEHAHFHWVWLHASESNQQSNLDLVNGYIDHNIRVGGLDIDSGWSTMYNNFEVDPEKFPSWNEMIQSFTDKGIWTILWATSMINNDDPNYQYALDNDFFIKTPRGTVRDLHWWHGNGALLDYTNKDAVAWWHSLLDDVLASGVRGFKCDGTDPYILEYVHPQTSSGEEITYREYADLYYSDFKDYTSQVNGDSLIWSRPVDCAVTQDVICMPFSPHEVMFSGWVGDDDATWQGMRSCARKAIYSAWVGFTGYGCDIGGYRDDHDEELGRDPEVFMRWAQLGSFLPLMENGGGGEHRPWAFDEFVSNSTETFFTDTYRKFVNTHYSLATYLQSEGTEAHLASSSLIKPVATNYDPEEPLKFPVPETMDFMLGPSLFVHPILEGKTESLQYITFPGDKGDAWRSFWAPSNVVGVGGDDLVRKFPLDSYPVYVRSGSILPLRVYDENDVLDSSYSLQFTVYGPTVGEESYQVHDQHFGGMTFSYTLDESGKLSFSLSAFVPPQDGDLMPQFSILFGDLAEEPTDINLTTYDQDSVRPYPRAVHHYNKLTSSSVIYVTSGENGFVGEMQLS